MHSGFDIDQFIHQLKVDTTFYHAFKNLRFESYTMYNDIVIDDKKGEPKATYHSQTKQVYNHSCRFMSTVSEKHSGDFFTRKNEYNYYTAKLYAHLFFTKDTVCNTKANTSNSKKSYTAKYEEQLRKLIFNPGQRIQGIPGIGDNVAIFEKPYIEKYRFTLSRESYQGEDCYIFKAIPKKEYKTDVVINELKTWFRVSDMAIVARDYSLSYRTLLYDFDVLMYVKLKKHAQSLIPYEIHYKGNWHVFGKPREMATFTAIFTDFE